jgi:hypothetical protein
MFEHGESYQYSKIPENSQSASPRCSIEDPKAYLKVKKAFPGATDEQMGEYLRAAGEVCEALLDGKTPDELSSTITVPTYHFFEQLVAYFGAEVAAEISGIDVRRPAWPEEWT